MTDEHESTALVLVTDQIKHNNLLTLLTTMDKIRPLRLSYAVSTYLMKMHRKKRKHSPYEARIKGNKCQNEGLSEFFPSSKTA